MTEVPNYPSNSHKASEEKTADVPKEDRKKLQKVVSGVVVARKPSMFKRLNEAFTGDDARTVGSYILFDVVVPAAKNMILDSVTQGAERAMFGEVRTRRSSGLSSTTRSNYTGYSRMTSRPTMRAMEPDEPRGISRRARATHDFSEITLPTRGDAEAAVAGMNVVMGDYGVVTVSDLYELVGITGSFVDHKWGWNDLRTVRIQRVRNGYLLDMPRPEPIE